MFGKDIFDKDMVCHYTAKDKAISILSDKQLNFSSLVSCDDPRESKQWNFDFIGSEQRFCLENYGEALDIFDKMKLVETKWTTPEDGIDGRPQKKYRSYYSAFNINISCPVNEISEIFNVASLNENEFEEFETRIYNFVGEDGKFGNMVAENFDISNLALKSLVKRSNRFCYKGLKLSRK